MNLLTHSWIPVRRRSGRQERVAPWQLTEGQEADPIVHLASPRPDFDGALAQLWIGLLQTAFAPVDNRGWRERDRVPPQPDELRAAFGPLAAVFDLLGEGPRFFQDLELCVEGQPERIERLLIESPGDNTLKEGKAHFVKGGEVEVLCPACAAAMLATLQTHAPSGGQGHRTGLRGGGPLTTLVWSGESLWHALWLNVLPRSRFLALAGKAELTRPEDTFPWLAPTRTSEKGTGHDTTAEDVHPAQMFFGMPRRLRLAAEERSPVPACDLCGEPASPAITGYVTKNLGVNYTGSWRHPQTPYRQDKAGALFSIKGDHAALSYRSYLGLVHNDAENGTAAAEVVRRLAESEPLSKKLRLWAFGFEMDNMKARAWCDGTMPLWQLPPEARAHFEDEVARWVKTAKRVEQTLLYAIKLLVSKRPKEVKGDLSGPRSRFWEETEPVFYGFLEVLAAATSAGADPLEQKARWHRVLVATARDVFESFAATGAPGSNPRRTAEAWRQLNRNLFGKAIYQTLDLPKAPPAAAPEALAGL